MSSGKFYRRLIIAFSLLTVLTVGLTSLLLTRVVRQQLIQTLTQNLQNQARLISFSLPGTVFSMEAGGASQELAKKLADASGSRISFIKANGVVAGDSAVSPEGLLKMENHGGRPEIKEALTNGIGSSLRHSTTIDKDLLYAAIPIFSKDALVGFIRLALPLTEIEASVRRLKKTVWMITLAMMVLAILLATRISDSLNRPVEEMSFVASKLEGGDYSARVRDLGPGELGVLGSTLNLLAERVQSKINELAHDKTRLATILFNMTEGVAAIDNTGRINAINPALASLFDLNPQDVQGKIFLEVLRHNQLNQILQDVLRDHQARIDEVRTFGPEDHIFEARVVPLLEENRPVGVLLVLHDITRIRRLEQVRRDFVANVSHELRTPLASIKGFAETLRLGGLDDMKNRDEFVQSIEKQADRMTSLVDDLLDLSAIESGQRTPQLEKISLTEVIREALDGLRPLAKKKEVVLEFAEPDNVPALSLDRLQIRQVMVNLLENGIKFNKKGGKVRVASAVKDSQVHVSIEDTGMGIPSQDLPRIFERFYRVDKARSRDMGGTGLGLAIVKHIVESHGGSVSVDSQFGKGSTFNIFFPLPS